MNRIFLTIMMLSAFWTSMSSKDFPLTRTPADDSRITYVGRTLKEDGKVSFDWTGVYAKVRFEGGYLAVKASDTKSDWYDVWIDREPEAEADKTLCISGQDSIYVLADLGIRKKDSSHAVFFKKRTEGEQGMTTMKEFITRGRILQADGLKSRQFEVIGDSYTCGYGTEGSVREDPFLPETENSNLTYAAIIARYFNADYYAIAHSGMGIARNYDGSKEGDYMPERYTRTFDENPDIKWTAGCDSFRPAITIIYLCTNDFSTGKQPGLDEFRTQYHKLLEKIAANYGEGHPILCISSKCDDMAADYVRDAVRTCSLKNVHFLSLTDAIHNDDGDLGASWHPNYQGHRKIAHAVIPHIATLTGWEMNDNIK